MLRGFRSALSRHYGAGGVTPEEFLAALVSGFTGEVPPREAAWAGEDLERDFSTGAWTAADVDGQLKVQILDLEDARDTGVYEDDWRSLGVTVKRREGRRPGGGSRWYNFGPQSYVECGVM